MHPTFKSIHREHLQEGYLLSSLFQFLTLLSKGAGQMTVTLRLVVTYFFELEYLSKEKHFNHFRILMTTFSRTMYQTLKSINSLLIGESLLNQPNPVSR